MKEPWNHAPEFEPVALNLSELRADQSRLCRGPAATHTRCDFSTTRDSAGETVVPHRRRPAAVKAPRSHAIS